MNILQKEIKFTINRKDLKRKIKYLSMNKSVELCWSFKEGLDL